MGAYIEAAQSNISTIVERISSQHGTGVRFGLISYRDHPPEDLSYVTKSFPFTEERAKMNEYVNTMSAEGGGDGPEAVTAGLHVALHLPWRPNATKICVLIADAPPHGLEPHGDNFPNGDPDGHDPLEIAREMVVQGIVVYTVGCEPALGDYQFARDFLCTLAEITSGQAVALSSAALLADVIINGSAEELSLARLQKQVEEEILKVQTHAREVGRGITSAEAVHTAYSNLCAEGVQTVQMETDGHMVNASKVYWGSMDASNKKSLAQVKTDLRSAYGHPEPCCPGVARPLCASYTAMPPTAVPAACLRAESRSCASYSAMPPTAVPAACLRAESRSCAAAAGTSICMPSVRYCAAPAPPPAPSVVSTPGLHPMPWAAPVSTRAAPVSTSAAASSNIMKTDLISEDQVARIMQKAQYQSRLL